MKNKAKFVWVALALCAVSMASYAQNQNEEVRFPDPGSAWMEGGADINVAQLQMMRTGLNKDQVRELLSNPHFSEGFFGVKTWNYLFNLRKSSGETLTQCQYQVRFRDGVTEGLYWNKPECRAFVG